MQTHPSPEINLRLKIYLRVIIAMLAGMAITLVVRFSLGTEYFASDQGLLGSYLQVVGGIYAVVIGFVIFVVWNQYNDSVQNIDLEVGRLRALARICLCLEDSQQAQKIRTMVQSYATNVVEESAASIGLQGRFASASDAWKELVLAIRSTPAGTPRESVVFSDLVHQLDRLSEIRSQRLSVTSARIPWILWDLMIFTTLITLLPFSFLGIQNIFLDCMVSGSITGALTFLLLVVHDLDNPFIGVFNVSFEPFRAVLEGD